MSLTDDLFQSEGTSLTDEVMSKREELRPMWQEILGSFSKGTQKGIAGMAGLPVDVATGVMNLLPGVNIQKPVGGSEWMLEKQQQATGAWQPQSLPGRVAEVVGEQVPGLVAGPAGRFVKGATLLRPSGIPTPPVTPRSFGREIKTLAPAAIGQTAGTVAARELIPNNPFAEAILGVAGGVTGAGATAAAQKWTSFDNMANRRLTIAAPLTSADAADPKALKMHQKLANNAVKDIVEANRGMSDGFKFTNAEGQVIRNGLPQTVEEAAEALPQAKAYFYKQYNDMQKAAGAKGLTFSGSRIADRIKALMEKEGMAPSEYEAAPYVTKQIEKYSDPRFAAMTPQQLENEIATVNTRIKAHNKTPNMHDVSRAKMDLQIASILNEELDSGITALEGRGYGELRDQYRNLKAIEGRLTRAAIRQANKSVKEGLYDRGDAFWLGEMGVSIASGHPSAALLGLTTIGFKRGKKWMYDADRNVKTLFKDADRMLPKEKQKFAYAGETAPPKPATSTAPPTEPPPAAGGPKTIKTQYLKNALEANPEMSISEFLDMYGTGKK